MIVYLNSKSCPNLVRTVSTGLFVESVGYFTRIEQLVDECFYYHSWRNNVVIAFGTLSSFLT